MSTARRFLLASSFARILLRECSANRVVEGHFPASHNRLSYVLFGDSTCSLVLVTNPGSPEAEVERTEVPGKQGQFLLEVCAGTLVYQRIVIGIDGARHAAITSFSVPGPLHLVELEFEDGEQADAFSAPIWFGPEVTGDPAFDHHAIATNGLPTQQAAPLSDASLHAVLDLLDGDSRSQSDLRGRQAHGVVEPFRSGRGL
jgi:hypothetical protein